MFIANRMEEIVKKSDARVQDIVSSHNKAYKHLDILFKKDASELKSKRPRSIENAEMSEFVEDDISQVSRPNPTKLRTKSAYNMRNFLEQKKRLE